MIVKNALFPIPESLPAAGAWTSLLASQTVPVFLEGSQDIVFLIEYDPDNSSTGGAVTLRIEWSDDGEFWYPTCVAKEGAFTAGSDVTDQVQRRLFKFDPTQDDNIELWQLVFTGIPFKLCRVFAKESGDTANPGRVGVNIGIGARLGAGCCGSGIYRYVSPTNAYVTGPSGGSTDNAVVRWDGTAGLVIQDSSATISDSGAIAITTIELGHASDTTLARASAGDVNIEGNIVYRAGGTDIPVTDGGTGASTAASARTNLGVAGYTLQQFTASFNPADATTYFLGTSNTTLMAINGSHRVYIPLAGTIKKAYVNVGVGGTLGTTENSTISVRLNNTTDTSIATTLDLSAAASTYSNTGLSIAVVAGDYIDIKWVTPTWATNPTNVTITVVIYIEP